jgi:SAM-dependent methyltransferase
MAGPAVDLDQWGDGAAYERYMGRWSRAVAGDFVRWLAVPAGARWLDVGCGTGALTGVVLAGASPSQVVALDPAEAFVRSAARAVPASLLVADAAALPLRDTRFDVVVSGLVLNFVPDKAVALAEMRRVVRAGGTVAAYVWDYTDGMQLLRTFWDTAVDLDPAAASRHESVRFGACRPDPLHTLFDAAGLDDVEVRPLVVPMVFRDREDHWSPFLSGHAPAPAYVRSLDEAHRTALRDALQARLRPQPDGSIRLTARAWAVRGTRRG